MFHNILVPVDGSPDADRALAHAVDVAECESARLTLMTAPALLPATAYLVAGEECGTLFENARAEAAAILRRACDRVPDDVSVSTLLSDQPIRIAVTHQIKDGYHDLVVMARAGAARSGLPCWAASATTSWTTAPCRC